MAMSEYVVVRCSSCSQKYRVTLSSIGRKARCRKCNTPFVIGKEKPVDDDTIVAWLTDEDPSSESVMGSTGIFQSSEVAPGQPAEGTGEELAVSAAGGRAERAVRLRKIKVDGAHFSFPAAALAGEELRNSFPRKCVGCGSRGDLEVHLLYWPERMVPHDRTHWADRVNAALGKLESFANSSDQALLKQLPRTRHVAKPFSLPFPVFACEYCDVSKEVEAHVLARERGEACRLRIASLAIAVGFFRNNGGRGCSAYHRLIEERDLRRDPWRELDPRLRRRVSQWFEPQAGERFVRFFCDTEFSALDSGRAGIVVTDRRLVFRLHAACEGYLLDQDARVELFRKGDLAIVHIYQEGHPPAVAKLDLLAVDELMATLEKLGCRWAVVT